MDEVHGYKKEQIFFDSKFKVEISDHKVSLDHRNRRTKLRWKRDQE